MPTLPIEFGRISADTFRMFLRSKKRFKDGKEHRYWSIVENRRVAGDRVVQRQVLYLGEINDSQKAAWCRTIEVVQEEEGRAPRRSPSFQRTEARRSWSAMLSR